MNAQSDKPGKLSEERLAKLHQAMSAWYRAGEKGPMPQMDEITWRQLRKYEQEQLSLKMRLSAMKFIKPIEMPPASLLTKPLPCTRADCYPE